jgi:excisionase family DNA binding protein
MHDLPPNDEPILLKVSQVSKMLNFCERTIRNLISSGDLPSVRIGRAIRIEKQVVCHFIEDRRAYNDDCAGLAMRDPQGERKCLNSAKSEKVSSNARAQSTGGPLTPTQAVKEFNDLLGQPARAKH